MSVPFLCVCEGSTGRANLRLRRARDSEYTPVITVIGKEDDRSVIMTTDRNIRLGIASLSAKIDPHKTFITSNSLLQVCEADVQFILSMMG